MSHFKAKVHQIRFWLVLCPRPHWGSVQRSPRPPSCDALLLRGGKGEEKGRGGEEGEEKQREREGMRSPTSSILL